MTGTRPLPDLRLASLATGTWLACVAALYLSSRAGLEMSIIAAVVAIVVATGSAVRVPLVLVRIGRPWIGRVVGGWPGRSLRRMGADIGRRGWGSGIDRPAVRWAVVAAAIGVACGAISTASHISIREQQPIAGLADSHASVALTMTLSSDPHRVGAAQIGPPTYALDAQVSSISVLRGTSGQSQTPSRYRVDLPVFVLTSGPGWAALLPGQRAVAYGRLAPSEPGELDAALLQVNTAPDLVGRPPWPQRAAGSLRAGLQRACAGLPDPVRGLLPGLIDGDTSRLDPAVSDAFRATGMTHLVAVSGSNVVMILGAALFLARGCRAGPNMTAVIGTVALVGFVILVRPSPSVLRAAAMGGIGLVSLATGRPGTALPALSAVIAALLVYDPALATDIGFGLSVFATAGLLLIAPHWRDALIRRGLPTALAEAIAVPAAAQVACSPMIASISGTVSLIAIPANLVVIPAVPVATVVGVAAAVVSPVWPAGAAFCAWLASWPARWLLFVAQHGAAAPAAVAAWPSGVWGGLLLAAVTIAGMFALRHRAARAVAAVSIVAAVLTIVPVRLATGGWPPAHALLVVCDVGQGDGEVLPLGKDAGVVVDTGPEPTAIDGCLRRLGIHDIPLLFLTHFHADHVGGLTGALDGRRVGAIVTSPFDQPPEGVRTVMQAAAARHIPVSTPIPGQIYTAGALRLTVLGPTSRLAGTRSDPNNNSLVMRADEADVRILLTGDAEIEEQNEVLAAEGAAALRCDFLKMPHHGSAYQAAAFLAAADPAVVFVSVGAVNPYGLPNEPTLDRLVAAGARVLRTDQAGDLAALTVGGRIAVEFRGHPPGQRPP